jgi:hypothetical protein
VNLLSNYCNRATAVTEKVTECLSFDLLCACGGSVVKPLHLREESEDPRWEAVKIGKDVIGGGVAETEPPGQRIAVLVH